MFERQEKVIAIVAEKNRIALPHGEIKGFMDPMTWAIRPRHEVL